MASASPPGPGGVWARSPWILLWLAWHGVRLLECKQEKLGWEPRESDSWVPEFSGGPHSVAASHWFLEPFLALSPAAWLITRVRVCMRVCVGVSVSVQVRDPIPLPQSFASDLGSLLPTRDPSVDSGRTVAGAEMPPKV